MVNYRLPELAELQGSSCLSSALLGCLEAPRTISVFKGGILSHDTYFSNHFQQPDIPPSNSLSPAEH